MSQLTNEELLEKLDEFYKKQVDQSEKAQQDAGIFKNLYKQYLEDQHYIDWNSWKFIKKESQLEYHKLAPFDYKDKANSYVINKVAILKLNGGLGTTMGCKTAKSLIPISSLGDTFLDVAVIEHEHICRHTFRMNSPLYLMNSFYTDEDTKKFISDRRYNHVRTFVQSKCPRLDAQTRLPVEDDSWGDDAWCPPGHGNIFQSLENSGLLDEMIAEGREVLFISNIDNVGAIVNFKIAKYMIDNQIEYLMECTEKTKADIKGGTLIEINEQMMHLEMPQVPPAHLNEFCSTDVFKIFNTNNIWVNLKAVKNALPNIKSEIIVNKKNVRGRPVLQLEFSVGGCIKNFPKSLCLHVPRYRFRPVKNVSDLLSLRSSINEMNWDQNVLLIRQQVSPPTIVNLDPSVFTNLEELEKRFPYFLNLKDCAELTVVGDVHFGENVRLHGRVTIRNEKFTPHHLPNNSRLENETKIFR